MNNRLISAKYLLLTVFVFITTLSFSQEDEKTEVPFAIIEEVPKFPNCVEIAKETGVSCFMQMMNNHIIKNFKYPLKAQQKNIQGKVTVFFTINTLGKITDIRTTAPNGCKLLEAEAVRIIKLLPNFEPGKQKGKPVSVSYAQPIMFKLQ